MPPLSFQLNWNQRRAGSLGPRSKRRLDQVRQCRTASKSVDLLALRTFARSSTTNRLLRADSFGPESVHSLKAEVDSLKAEVARREKYAEDLEKQIADLSAEVESQPTAKQPASQPPRPQPKAPAESPTAGNAFSLVQNTPAQRSIEDPSSDPDNGSKGVCIMQAGSSEVGTTQPDSVTLSRARAQVDLWFQLRSLDFRAQVFERHAGPRQDQSKLTREKVPDCLADLGVRIRDVDKLFKQVDRNEDGVLSFEEFDCLRQHQTPLRAWASGLPLADLVAHALPVKAQDVFAEDLCQLDGRAIEAVVQAVSEGFKKLLLENVALLVKTRQAQAADGGAAQKFQLDPLSCGSADDFQSGLVDRVGNLSLKTMVTMRKEHMTFYGSYESFTTFNYHITTRPCDEWLLVEGADGKSDEEFAAFLEEKGLKVGLGTAHHGRRIPNVAVLQLLESVKDAGLSREELYAIVLYTGPMFMRYNMILRRFPKEDYAHFEKGQNLFSTTILVLVSAPYQVGSEGEDPARHQAVSRAGQQGPPANLLLERQAGAEGLCRVGLHEHNRRSRARDPVLRGRRASPRATFWRSRPGQWTGAAASRTARNTRSRRNTSGCRSHSLSPMVHPACSSPTRAWSMCINSRSFPT